MLSDRIQFDSQLGLVKLQRAISDVGLSQVLLSIAVVALTALTLDYSRMLYLRWRMPPGPFPWPIVGNTYSLPKNKPWIYFEELSKKYNAPLITFWIGR